MSTMHWRGINENTVAIAFEVHGKKHVLFEETRDGRIFIYARHGDRPWGCLGVIREDSINSDWTAKSMKVSRMRGYPTRRCPTRRAAINYILEAA